MSKIEIIVGSRGYGKTLKMFEEMRIHNCRKYRLATAGINWKDKRDL